MAHMTPTVEDSKSAIQIELDKAGISYAKSWNRAKLIEAWHEKYPAIEQGEDMEMGFGPICSKFMLDNGLKAKRSTANRTWFKVSRSRAVTLLEDLDAEISRQADEGSKADARKLARAHDRIASRL